MGFARGLLIAMLLVPLTSASAQLPAPLPTTAPTPFSAFLLGFRVEARAAGVSRATFDRALANVEPDLTLPDLAPLPGTPTTATKRPSGQAEFTRPPQAYLDKRQLTGLALQGKALRLKHAEALATIEARFGVEPEVVLAIWGRETSFGQWTATHDVIRSLATLAWRGRRPELFRRELIFALKLLEDGIVQRADMRGSWAGAMGLTQFMPSEFYETAQALAPGQRPDLFRSVPDALASAANQLKIKGWKTGQPWGLEVKLPVTISCAQEGIGGLRPLRAWLADGVRLVRADRMSEALLDQPVFLLSPAGALGPQFLAFENFLVLKAYNFADLYALFVGNLADRIAGRPDFATTWGGLGGNLAQLSATDLEEIQRRLKAAGEPIEKVDGKAGMNTRSSVGRYQARSGLIVDCWASPELLARLRKAP